MSCDMTGIEKLVYYLFPCVLSSKLLKIKSEGYSTK